MSIIGGLIIIGGSCLLYFYLSTPTGPNYKNPIFEPVLADPSILKAEDGYFYAYGTEDDWRDGKGPRIVPIVRSNNLVEWEHIGEAFQERPNWKENGGIWAPDVSYFNDKYYMYYSQSVWGDENPAIGVATSDTPEGPFEDQGKLFDSHEINVNNSIDPQLYIEDDGKPYLFWGSWYGIWGIELSKDGLDYVGEKFQIAGEDFEAPYIIKRTDDYYLFVSKGSCCEGQDSTYHIAVGRSKSLEGPYLDKNDQDLINSSGTDLLIGGDRFVGPGHNSVISDSKNQDWLVYHAIDKGDPWIGRGTTRRSLFLDKIVWKEGWPTIEGKVPSQETQEGPIIK